MQTKTDDKVKHPPRFKSKKRRQTAKTSTIAQLASTPQHIDDKPTTQSQPLHHVDDDYIFLLADDNNGTPNDRPGVVEVDDYKRHG